MNEIYLLNNQQLKNFLGGSLIKYLNHYHKKEFTEEELNLISTYCEWYIKNRVKKVLIQNERKM